jgi:hypothetical protein
MRGHKKIFITLGASLTFLISVLFVLYCQVDNLLTPEDNEFIERFMEDGNVQPLAQT